MTKFGVIAFAVCVVMGLITVAVQFHFMASHYGPNYVRTTDYERHLNRAVANEDYPIRYRLLADQLIARAMPLLAETQDGMGYESVVFTFRVMENAAIFAVLLAIMLHLGIGAEWSIVGLMLAGWCMSFSYHESGGSQDTYLIILFVLASALMAMRGARLAWFIALALAASCTRDESVFIPVILLAVRCSLAGWRWPTRRDVADVLLVAAVVAVTRTLVKWGIGPARQAGSRYGFIDPGAELLWLNLLNLRTWQGLFYTFAIPALALPFIRRWHPTLIALGASVGLPWFAAEFIFGSADETRLFVGVLLLVMVPAAMYCIAVRPRVKES